MRHFLKIAAIVIAFLVSIKGNTQAIIFPRKEITQNQLFVSIGFEPELVSTVGYIHLVGNSNKKINFHLGAGLKFDPLVISKAWRSNLITTADWRFSNRWRTGLVTNIYLAHALNRTASMNGLGFELRSSVINYSKRWAKGFDLGWQFTAFTHIKNSDATKNTFNDRYSGNNGEVEGPRDGWYSTTASRFRVGFISSIKMNNHLRLQLGIGSLINVQKQGIIFGFSHAQIPFYFESLLLYQW
jgi:hypothetical protein